MPLFLSTYTNKLDKKGRISVPAPFRARLEGSAFAGFVVFPHPEIACLEAWDMERMERFAEGMDEYAPMSAEYAAVSTLMTRSKELAFDPEGRVTIPEAMLAEAGITDQVKFAGRGQTFQLWQPGAYDAFEADSAALARANGGQVRLAPRRPMPATGPETGGGNG